MYRSLQLLAIIAAPALIAGCGDTSAPLVNGAVSMQDQCDPASFNAALGPGTCAKQGNTTFAQFNNELSATQQVAAWRFVPASLTIHVGQSITAVNDGGEVHTFTEVEQFGGGEVAALNTASGNSVEAPECKQLSPSDHVASGARFTTDAATEVGTEYYQCCIHPWMRETVTVTR